MQSLAHWWHRWTRASVRQAWGLAHQEGTWVLVGLNRHSADRVRVHSVSTLPTPSLAQWTDADFIALSQYLREQGRGVHRARNRLNMALPKGMVHEGFVDLPADLPQEDWPYEVQLHVAQALQLKPEAVNFDFEPGPVTYGGVQRLHWIGCAQTQMATFKSCTRAAGWRLAAVESPAQAAERGVRAMRGGAVSLLTQAPQDWQFHVSTGGVIPPPPAGSETPENTEAANAQALAQAMQTPGGVRLVAAGLALRAWQ